MKKLAFIITLILFLYGCSRTINTLTYYILDFPVAINQNDTERLSNDVCEILPVQVAEAYAEKRIALRKRSHEIIYYHYHQWGESPDQNISRLIQKKLNADGLFESISERVWNVSPRYQLNTRVNSLEVIEGEDSLFAHISITLELYDKKISEIAVVHDFDDKLGFEEWDLNDIALGMSDLLKNELSTFSYKIRVYLISQSQSQ